MRTGQLHIFVVHSGMEHVTALCLFSFRSTYSTAQYSAFYNTERVVRYSTVAVHTATVYRVRPDVQQWWKTRVSTAILRRTINAAIMDNGMELYDSTD